MKYLILGTPFRNQNYRGVTRNRPGYVEGAKDDDPANRCFYWLLEEGGETGLVENLSRAGELINEYAKLPDPQIFEILGITDAAPYQIKGHELIGFDIADNSYSGSVLETFFDFDPSTTIQDPFQNAVPLLLLMQKHFGPLIQENGLFSKSQEANFFLSCFEALRAVFPNLWEQPEITFQVLGLWELESEIIKSRP
jgi:hypothetical protein